MGPKFPCIQYTCTERNVNETYLSQQWLAVSLRIEWGQWPPLSCLGLPVFWEDQGTWHWDWIRQVRNIQKLYIYPNVFRYRGFQKIIRYLKKYTNTCIWYKVSRQIPEICYIHFLCDHISSQVYVWHPRSSINTVPYCLKQIRINSIPFLPISLK